MRSSGMGLLPAVLPCATITGIGTVTNTTLQMIKKNIDRKKKKTLSFDNTCAKSSEIN